MMPMRLNRTRSLSYLGEIKEVNVRRLKTSYLNEYQDFKLKIVDTLDIDEVIDYSTWESKPENDNKW